MQLLAFYLMPLLNLLCDTLTKFISIMRLKIKLTKQLRTRTLLVLSTCLILACNKSNANDKQIKIFIGSSREQAIVRSDPGQEEKILCSQNSFDKYFCVDDISFKKIVNKLSDCGVFTMNGSDYEELKMALKQARKRLLDMVEARMGDNEHWGFVRKNILYCFGRDNGLEGEVERIFRNGNGNNSL